MDMQTLKGALRSKTVWWNVLLALLASLEMFAGNLTVLFGQNAPTIKIEAATFCPNNTVRFPANISRLANNASRTFHQTVLLLSAPFRVCMSIS